MNFGGKLSPGTAISLRLLPCLMVGSQLFVLLLSCQISIFPEAGDWKSIVGTCAEIIAGLYGITTAGFTFFLSRIDSLSAGDCTLEYVTSGIKSRFKYLIWYITLNVLMTLLTSISLMYMPIPTEENMGFLYRLFCNEFLLFLIFSVSLILYYSILVIDPNCIAKEAARQKKRLSGGDPLPGDPVEFIALYHRIEQCCDRLLPQSVTAQLRKNKGSAFELKLRLLETRQPLMKPLILDLTRLHRYYACVINSPSPDVSQEMCLLANKILRFLEPQTKTLQKGET